MRTRIRAAIPTIRAIATARGVIESGDPLIVDVREQDEFDECHIPCAVHIPRGNLESRIESHAPDRTRPVVVYCSMEQKFLLQPKGEIGNPYVTAGMRHCGQIRPD